MAVKQVAPHLVTINCSGCDVCAVSPLLVTQKTVDVYGVPLGVVTDKELIKNINPFLFCKNKPLKKCTPEFVGGWMLSACKSVEADGERILVNNSFLMCKYGGKATIDLPDPAKDGDVQNPIDKLKDKINGIYDTVAGGLTAAGEAVSESLMDALRSLTGPIKDLMNTPGWQDAADTAKNGLAEAQAAKNAIDKAIRDAEKAYQDAVDGIKSKLDEEVGDREDELFDKIEEEIDELITEVENGINDGLDELNNYFDNEVDVDYIIESVLSDETLSASTGWTDSDIADYIKETYRDISTEYKEEIDEIKEAYNNYDGDSEEARLDLVGDMLDLFDTDATDTSNVTTPDGSPLTPDQIRAIISQKIDEEIDKGFEDAKDEVSETADEYRDKIGEEIQEIKDKYSLNNYLQGKLDEALDDLSIQKTFDEAQAISAEAQQYLNKAKKILNTISNYDALVKEIWKKIIEEIGEKYGEEIAEIVDAIADAKKALNKLNKNLSLASAVYDGIQFLANGLPVGLVLICGSGGSGGAGGGAGGGGAGGGGAGGDGDDEPQIIEVYATDLEGNILEVESVEPETEIKLIIISKNAAGMLVDIDLGEGALDYEYCSEECSIAFGGILEDITLTGDETEVKLKALMPIIDEIETIL